LLVTSSDNSDGSDNTTRNCIGKVIFTEKEKYIQDDSGAKTFGYIKGQYKEMVSQGENLVLFHREEGLKFYVRIEKIENYPIIAGGFEKRISETATHLHLKPFLEISPVDNYRGPYRPHALENFEIDFPNSEELAEINKIPREGLPLGYVVTNGSHTVFNYPLRPDDTIFQSMLIAGVQRSGKTNFTKLLVQALYSKTNTSVIILDREGEYGNFTEFENLPNESKKFFSTYGLQTIKPQVLKLSNDFFEANATMSINGIDLEDMFLLLPELEIKSSHVAKSIANQASNTLRKKGLDHTWPNLQKEILLEVHSTQFLSGAAGSSIKGAIERALIPHNHTLFDQNGKIPLTPENLCKKHSVTIIDCQSLSVDQQRMVALYLMLMLNKHKFKDGNTEPGVLLFIDEAEVLFPKKPEGTEKYFVPRIEQLACEPVRRGRKHKFGLVLITHLVGDISSAVGSLCNTKIAFRSTGCRTWIRDNFGREKQMEIEMLPTGQCRINTVKTSVQMDVKLHVPLVGDKEDI